MMVRRRLYRICALICIFVVLLGSVTVYAAQSKVMVVSYSIQEKTIKSGGEFTLDIVIRNTGTRKVTNLKVAATSDTGEIVPAEGAGTAYIEGLDAGTDTTVTFKMKAAAGLEEKSYKLTVTSEYDDSWSQYAVTDTIYLPVTIEQRASVTSVYTEGDMTLGDSVEITGSVNNEGAGALYNVKARVECDYLDAMTTYIGKIDAGKTGSIDILTNASATTDSDASGKLIVTYEDKEGNESRLESSFQITVNSPVYENVEKIKDAESSSVTACIPYITAGVIVIILAAIAVVRKRKRKKAILEEFEER